MRGAKLKIAIPNKEQKLLAWWVVELTQMQISLSHIWVESRIGRLKCTHACWRLLEITHVLPNEIGFFVISAIPQVAHFCSFAEIATFNFAPRTILKTNWFSYNLHVWSHQKSTPKINTFDIGVRARGCKIHRNAQGFSSKVAPQCALGFRRVVEITQGF